MKVIEGNYTQFIDTNLVRAEIKELEERIERDTARCNELTRLLESASGSGESDAKDEEKAARRSSRAKAAKAADDLIAKVTGKRGRKPKASSNGSAEAFLDYVKEHPGSSMSEICKGAGIEQKPATIAVIKRDLGDKIRTEGQKRGTRYFAK